MDPDILSKYLEKLEEKSVTAENGECVLWCGSVKAGGYGVINVKLSKTSPWRSIVVHRVSFMMHNNTPHLDKHGDVSHLCHNSLCINPKHLSLEPHHINNNRQFCKMKGHCLGHHSYPLCRLDLVQ